MYGLYLSSIAVMVSAASIAVAARGSAAEPDAALSSGEVGFLCGGWRRALHTAVYALLERGSLRITRRGTITRDGALPAGSPALERAVYRTAVIAVGMSALERSPKVRSALRDVQSSLAARGLVLPRWRHDVARVAPTLALATAVAGLVSSLPAFDWLLTGVSVCLAALTVWVWRTRPLTAAGRTIVRDVRSQYPKPKPRGNDDAGSGEAASVATSVALYGIWTATAMGTAHGAMRSTLSESFFGGDSGDGAGGGGGGGDSGGY